MKNVINCTAYIPCNNCWAHIEFEVQWLQLVSFVQEGLSFIYNFSGVNRTMVDRIQLRVAAQNNFTMGPFSEHAYLSEPADVN